MDFQRLNELMQQPEHEKLDFKEKFNLETESSKKEFAKDVCAMANAKGGRGYILFGIRDKTKEVTGVTLQYYDEERIQQIISKRVYPPCTVRVDTIEYQQKIVLAITIFKSDSRPHQFMSTGAFYIRRGSTTDIATRNEIAAMMQEHGLLCFENILQPKATLDDLNMERVKQYFSYTKEETNTLLLLMDSLQFIGRSSNTRAIHPTNGGLLLFGENPQLFLPYCSLRITKGQQTVYEHGSIPQLLQKTESLFSSLNYPLYALQESVFNALVHRDYWDTSHYTAIRIEKDKITVTNPGAIADYPQSYKLENDPNPPHRNSWLYQRLLLMNKNQLYQNPVGLKMMREETNKKVRIINDTKRNQFKVIFPLNTNS